MFLYNWRNDEIIINVWKIQILDARFFFFIILVFGRTV